MPDISGLANFFARKVVGQPNAAERILPFIRTFQADLHPANRPIGVFLLLGPTGTGKTHTIEVLAEALHGDAQKYLRVDCGEFQFDHEVAKLIGAPPGYIGHAQTVPMLSKQKLAAVTTEGCEIVLVLFDEVEKAAPSLGQLLLGILDKAILKTGDNQSVSFETALIFLTSNLGAVDMMRELSPSFGFEAAPDLAQSRQDVTGKLEAIALAAVKKRFSPEFVNRIDAVITYHPLSAESIRQVLDNQIAELEGHVRERLGPRGFSVHLDESARAFLVDRGVSVAYGARELKRTIYRHVTQPLATMVAESQVPSGSIVEVSAGSNTERLTFDVHAAPSGEPKRPSVLIVDDNEPLLSYLAMAVTRDGWELTTAGSAEAALRLAETRRFDLGLIDYMLPDLDGAALSLKLRALLPEMKIVLMTGGGEMAFSQKSEFANTPVLQKPFIVGDLLNLLREALGEGGQKDRSASAASP